MKVKGVTKIMSDFNFDSNHAFFKFYKGCDELKEMPLDSKHNRLKDFNRFLIVFKNLKTKK